MKEYYESEIKKILAKYDITNPHLILDLTEFVDEEVFQAACDANPDN